MNKNEREMWRIEHIRQKHDAQAAIAVWKLALFGVVVFLIAAVLAR